MGKKKMKLRRKFDGEIFEFVGSRGTKQAAQRHAKVARKNNKKVRVVKRGKGAASWHIFERKKR